MYHAPPVADPSTSLVVASFNQPRSLRLVLRGVLGLRRAPDELWVADDGSEPGIEALVREFGKEAPFPVHFAWQENLGFRKSAALNNALRRAEGDHLLFLDGDTIPHPDWLREHRRALALGASYATGGYVHLDLAQAEAIEAGASPLAFLSDGEKARLRRVHRRNRWHGLLRKPDKPKILGGNWSVKRDALWRVNGFDEHYAGGGKEDSDIRNRLNAAGFRGASVWDRAFVFHCAHELDPARHDPAVRRGASDRAYYEEAKGRPRCEQGLVQGRE